MSTLSPAEMFMATFFGVFGQKSTVNSHEPHANLNKHAEGYATAQANGWVTVEPYNRHGSVTIKATEEGARVAMEAARVEMARLFPEVASLTTEPRS